LTLERALGLVTQTIRYQSWRRLKAEAPALAECRDGIIKRHHRTSIVQFSPYTNTSLLKQGMTPTAEYIQTAVSHRVTCFGPSSALNKTLSKLGPNWRTWPADMHYTWGTSRRFRELACDFKTSRERSLAENVFLHPTPGLRWPRAKSSSKVSSDRKTTGDRWLALSVNAAATENYVSPSSSVACHVVRFGNALNVRYRRKSVRNARSRIRAEDLINYCVWSSV